MHRDVYRPWSVWVAGVLLLIFEAVYLAVGLYALAYGSWEGLAAIGTIWGLIVGAVGLAYLAFTAPALFGRRFARIVLAILTVPVAAWGVRQAILLVAYPIDYLFDDGLVLLVSLGPPVSALFPVLAVVLLFLPPSRPFFARRRPLLA